MKEEEKSAIRELVREKIKDGSFNASSYWDWFRWVKSLEFGHRPTKEETQEVLFFGISLKQNPDNWRAGAEELARKASKLGSI